MPGKRSRASESERLSSPPQPDSEAQRSVFAYDEIFLRIMSFLSPTDLAVVQGVSKHWARISLDPQVSHIDHKQILIPVMLNVSFQIYLYSYGKRNILVGHIREYGKSR